MPPNGATSVLQPQRCLIRRPFEDQFVVGVPYDSLRNLRDHTLIDADHAVLQRLAHPEAPADVAAVEVGGEASGGVIRDRNGLQNSSF